MPLSSGVRRMGHRWYPTNAARHKITARESKGFHFESEVYDEAKLAKFASTIMDLAGEITGLTLNFADRRKV